MPGGCITALVGRRPQRGKGRHLHAAVTRGIDPRWRIQYTDIPSQGPTSPSVDAMSAPPVTAVLFDVHSTLLHGGDPHAWLAAGLARVGRSDVPDWPAGPADADATAAWLDRVWEHARVLDPHARRDLSPTEHRRVWDETTADAPGLDRPLADALYDVMTDHWAPYDDTLPVLDALRARGVRIGALSNIGFDLRPLFERTGIASRLDALVLSFEAGVAKPDPAIFRQALDALGSTAQETLMVGDSWQDDAGAAGIGVRTLVLPRTDGPEHGLDLVLRLVG